MGRLRAYVADLQSSLNAHLAGLGSHERLEIDGEWGEHTARAFGRVCRVLGLEPARNVRTFRLVVGATQQRTPEELARAQADGAAYAQRLRHHFAHEQRRQRPTATASSPRGGDARRARHPRPRRALRGRRRPRGQARAACRSRSPARSLEKETGFRNVFGHDAVRNPVKSPPRRPAGGHPGELPPVPAAPPPGARQPGRRADAADEPRPAGPRRPARRLLAAGPEHPRRRSSSSPATSGAWGCAPAWSPTTARARRAALRRRRAGPRAALGAAPARRPPAAPQPSPSRPRRPGPGRPAPRRHAADLPPGVAADARARRGGLPAAAQRALRRLEHRQAHRRRRRVRADDPPGGAPGRLRPGDLGDRARPRRDARAAQQAAPTQPAHARRGRPRHPAPGLARAGCAASTRASGAQAALAYARKHLGVVESPPGDQSRAAHRSLEPGDRHRRRAARGAATSPTPA